MCKERYLKQQTEKYTFATLIEMMEKTENVEEKRSCVNIINRILEREQEKIINNKKLCTH